MKAGRELGITVVAPFSLKLASGDSLIATAYLPELGAERGTLVFTSPFNVAPFFPFLKLSGYTCSTYGNPSLLEIYDVESYRDMFRDWGWTSLDNKKPSWMEH